MRRASLAAIGTIGLLITVGLTAYAAAAQQGTKTRPLTIRMYGARISTGEYVFKVVDSLDGTGAAITRVISSTPAGFPDRGTSVTTIYFRDGLSKQKISFTQDAPNSKGISPFRGHGKCAGGTGIHKHEKCTYTFKGTYSVITSQNDLRIAGTDTR